MVQETGAMIWRSVERRKQRVTACARLLSGGVKRAIEIRAAGADLLFDIPHPISDLPSSIFVHSRIRTRKKP